METTIELSIKQAKGFQHFETRDEFNTNIEMFLAVHKNDFTPTEYIAFKRLTKMAFNPTKGIYGVAFSSIKYILKKVKELDVLAGISESTFQRMKRKAIKLGILEVSERSGKNGRSTTNLFVFKKYNTNRKEAEIAQESNTIDTPHEEGEQHQPALHQQKVFKQLTPLNSINLFNPINLKDLNKRSKKTDSTINLVEAVSFKVPNYFKQRLKPFTETDTIEHCFFNANNKFKNYLKRGFNLDAGTFEELANKAIDRTLYVYRQLRQQGKTFRVNAIACFTKSFCLLLENLVDANHKKGMESTTKQFFEQQKSQSHKYITEEMAVQQCLSSDELDALGVF